MTELKDQVLSLKQVRELQELGFDINKYATFFIAEGYYDGNKYIVNKEMINNEVIYNEIREYFPTLTIGDILNILPEKINKNYSLEISKNHVDYCDDHISINWEKEEKLIDSLFEMLKWCIKEKHIEL